MFAAELGLSYRAALELIETRALATYKPAEYLPADRYVNP